VETNEDIHSVSGKNVQRVQQKVVVSGNMRFVRAYSRGFLGVRASDENLMFEMSFFSISVLVSSIFRKL